MSIGLTGKVRRWASAVGLAWVLIPSGLAADPLIEPGAAVTYVTGGSVYIDVGSEVGLKPGDRVDVLRADGTTVVLEVVELSASRSVCAVVESAESVEVGDAVGLPAGLSVAAPAAPDPESAPSVSARSDSRRRSRKVHGRVGLRYLFVDDRAGFGSSFSQPGVDLFVEGRNLAKSNLDFGVDLRAKWTRVENGTAEATYENRTRPYRAAVAWHDPRSRYRVTVGRQVSATLAALSIFDGVSAEFNRPTFSAGLFAGAQPDGETLGFSGDVRETGFYFRMHHRPGAKRRWEVTTGLIGSYQEGIVNREYWFVQGFYWGKRLSIYATQNVDYNRDWKVDVGGESTLEPTSTFANVRYRFDHGTDLYGGYDNRRNVRLYRDRVTPETEFDDSFRKGVWLGVAQRFLRHYRVSLDAKSNSGGTAGTADSLTGIFTVDGLTRYGVELGYRGTLYRNDRLEGSLHALRGGLTLAERYHLSLQGGIRDDENRVNGELDDTVLWLGVDFDVVIGRSWLLLWSLEQSNGDLEEVTQAFLRVTYRF